MKVFNVILIDSVYRKDENYYSKMIFEKNDFNGSDEEYFDNSDDSYDLKEKVTKNLKS